MSDPLGRTSSMTYDLLDRPLTTTYVDATLTWQYDAAGRRTRVDDTQFGVLSLLGLMIMQTD
ncbi:MAG: hypothetical protein HY819_07160 [Acidobacteria bacterium]|nr:hypothetical protein [Acidobacteriota bacterium]